VHMKTCSKAVNRAAEKYVIVDRL
jgi:hypothetical protein